MTGLYHVEATRRHAAGKFDRVVLVSHVPTLRDAFDQTLEVVKGADGISRVAA